MLDPIRQLIEHRDLLLMITWREIRIKYKQTIFGFLWAIFMPMVVVSAGILIRYAFSVLSNTPLTLADITAVSVKAVPWAFFITSIRYATYSLIANTNLITKVYMPREIFPIAAILSQFADFLVASFVLVVVLGIARVGFSIYLLWVPLLVLSMVALSMGLGIILSAASLFFRDVKYLVEIAITYAIFFTPVFYEVSMFGKWGNLLLLNPVAPIFEALNDSVVRHTMPDIAWLSYSGVVSITCLLSAFALFKKLEPAFAESI